ncbi:hypothetical protein FZC84_19560 [Rossellomorea vietnamensis]|uniref:Uncharacterized protein n=1 Tax=Rossellomorea vietnamensis TaxID=218284 RepID=A0A5D4M6D8_9BACI|nr:hypothetical protein [Rossellomorea vietnamensis]TYR97018.1 hypothetical protein FZC84_19560 [Rossellomorea vietnamensis]
MRQPAERESHLLDSHRKLAFRTSNSLIEEAKSSIEQAASSIASQFSSIAKPISSIAKPISSIEHQNSSIETNWLVAKVETAGRKRVSPFR